MRDSTLPRILGPVMCGLWFWIGSLPSAHAGEQVKVIQLRGGELRLVNNDERKPKAVINGKEFLFVPDYIGFKETLQLSDRDVIILTSDTDRYSPPKYRVFSLTTTGLAQEIDDLTFRTVGTLVATKKGDAIHFDLGYYRGLKVNAVLSSAGVEVSRRPVARPAFDQKDCKWMYETALDNCINDLETGCDLAKPPSRTAFALNAFEHHPRWKVAESRFEATCQAACKAKKRPSFGAFAKNVCGT
jgi:hypothetical protein